MSDYDLDDVPKQPRPKNLSKEQYRSIVKDAMKEGIAEWLDKKAAAFGYWSIKFMGCALFGALVIFTLRMNGWSLPK